MASQISKNKTTTKETGNFALKMLSTSQRLQVKRHVDQNKPIL
jgi:hypothetical protein